MINSNINGFYRMNVEERIDELFKQGVLTSQEHKLLINEYQVLSAKNADNMSENVIGVFGLPYSIATNFQINQRDYIVPMVVEEPSIVAGVSGAAKIIRNAGGFKASISESLLIGQIQLLDIEEIDKALLAIEENKSKLIHKANSSQPKLIKRGGGVRDIEIRHVQTGDHECLVLHILIDTKDAMGANLINTVCEYLADDLAELISCDIGLKILSNLTDRSLVDVGVKIPSKYLAKDHFSGNDVRDSIVKATNFANADPYRAATHNKGIMNGVDAVAIATGNDWRAIEAGAHAYACRQGSYRSLSDWSVSKDGDLIGRLILPLKIGIVGGSLTANPAARLGLKITSVKTAEELAMVICSVGLAQNLAALRALVTHGIQKGHMRLHAKSVAMSINTPKKFFDDVVSEMIDSGEIKAWKAQDILHEKTLKQKDPININLKNKFNGLGAAAGKIILFGEHAVVYGESAIALPIENAVQVVIEETEKCSQFIFNGYEQYILDKESSEYSYMLILVQKICELLEIKNHKFKLNIISRIPISMGLGSSASFAVAIIRAIISLYDLPLTNDRVNAIAFECEKISHGNPSGIDNTVATYGRPILFRKNTKIENLENNNLKSLPILIAISKQSSRTVDVVKEVSLRYEKDVGLYSNIFKQLGRISKDSLIALRENNLEKIGAMMNVSHGLLNAIGISNNELEKMVYLARSKGALGAKITGSGGGGSIIILCPEKEQAITDAFELAGYGVISMNISRCE